MYFTAFLSIIDQIKRLDSRAATLTNISQCFNAALNISLLKGVEPGAVVDPESRLEQLDEDRLVCL